MPLLPPRWRLLLLAVVALSLPVIAGIVWLFLTGSFDEVHGLVPTGALTLKNWRFLWEAIGSRPPVYVPLLNSMAFSIVVAVVVVTIASMAAYSISRLGFPGRSTFLALVLILHAFPAVSLIIAIFYILRLLGLFDTLTGLILVKASLELPLGIWLMKGFFDSLSWEMEMAALVDGMSRWTLFWRIAMPMVRPGILALGTFSLLSAWGEFILPFTLIVSTRSWTMALYLQSFIGEVFTDYRLGATVGLFYALPVIVVFLVGQRYLLNVYSGGVKG